VALLAAAQIHRDPVDALDRAPDIAREYGARTDLRLFGYELGAEVAGVAGVEPGLAGAAIVRDLAVSEAHRRAGIGRALLDFLRGPGGFVAFEGDTLASSVGFYERCGFSVRADGAMPNGETRYRFSWPPESS
jgi:GNAT superfamily N-acetyltransferase